ncbi:MAG: Ig-like domain-containing protein [Burkholderiales bacterium]|nr:Ig-like domain-containing protein [Burkholderiales bacterium]
MRNIFFGQGNSRFPAYLLIAAVIAALGGCGGGSSKSATAGGGAASAPAAVTAATTASTAQLLVSSPQMNSSGASTTTLTAIVLGLTGQVIPGRTVVFSKGADPTAYISNLSAVGVSDANGLVTAQLNLGASKANRTITISATVDGITATNSVSVVGTTISFSGNNSLAFGASTPLTITVKDSAGNIVPGVAVTVSSQQGNTVALAPANGITDATGSITATVTATKAGNDVITATAAGATKAQNLTISNASFTLSGPPAAAGTVPQINVNTATPLSALWTNTGLPQVGQAVTFTASRGTITGSPATTDATGTATASISSPSSGPAIITASGVGGTPSATLNVNFVATTATSITVQSSPSTIQLTNTAVGQTSNSSTISAVVRDAALNLVQNARVSFSITQDTSSGRLSAATATTDASGTASVTYTAGAVSGAQNGVTISATVVDINGVPIVPAVAPSSISLTIGGSALFVRLGTDNLVASAPPNYSKTYSALVTDSAGNPAPAGTQVRFVLRPVSFSKGQHILVGGVWSPAYTATCGNEDINFNGIRGPVSVSALPNPLTGMSVAGTQFSILTNDYNGNGRLDPGNVASVNGTTTTDVNGFALATISYAKNYAYWVTVTLEARAGVVGNDPPSTATLLLPGLVSDYSNPTVAPPGQASPFGLLAGCNNSN